MAPESLDRLTPTFAGPAGLQSDGDFLTKSNFCSIERL